MTQANVHPRLHMGCGEALRSHWFMGMTQPARKSAAPAHRSGGGKRKRERTRG